MWIITGHAVGESGTASACRGVSPEQTPDAGGASTGCRLPLSQAVPLCRKSGDVQLGEHPDLADEGLVGKYDSQHQITPRLDFVHD